MNGPHDSFEVWSGLKPDSRQHATFRTYDAAKRTARRIMLRDGKPSWVRRVVDGHTMWICSATL